MAVPGIIFDRTNSRGNPNTIVNKPAIRIMSPTLSSMSPKKALISPVAKRPGLASDRSGSVDLLKGQGLRARGSKDGDRQDGREDGESPTDLRRPSGIPRKRRQ